MHVAVRRTIFALSGRSPREPGQKMNHTALGILMIVGGLGLASGGIALLMRRQPDSRAPAVSPRTIPPAVSQEAREAPPSRTPGEKGEAFEKWVVKRFSPDYFSIKDWRGDKYVEGRYAESSENPDLEIEFRLRDVRASFAVECKWRRAFDQGEKPGIEWATERQIANYGRFAQDRRMPVFVVIGIGGEPDSPAEVYVAHLSKLRYPRATAEYLARFRRSSPKGDFFYDYKKTELK